MLLMILYNIDSVLQPFDQARFQPGFIRRFYQPGKVKLPAERLAPAVGGDAPEPFHRTEAESVEPRR